MPYRRLPVPLLFHWAGALGILDMRLVAKRRREGGMRRRRTKRDDTMMRREDHIWNIGSRMSMKMV